MPNRLSESASPYLLMHAAQPVDWQEWGPGAWAQARERDVPVFVSLGYAACHWCHVMADETFDNPEIARILNENFVCIKVDREQRPDVDAVFMAATQALTGSGGWPNSVFCTPSGEPFFAGTYFPPEPRDGLPGFAQLASALGQAWRDRRDEVVESGRQIATELRPLQAVPGDEAVDLHAARQQLFDEFDPLHGGWGSQPKFPNPMVIDALLVSGDPGELDMATHALEAMARGAIRDQLGGGFHRYSVDAGWLVPHFEKMLADNALLLGAYTRGWRRTPDHDSFERDLFAEVAGQLVGWIDREMMTDDGLAASGLDADSGDIRGIQGEGIYYVWSPELLRDALGDDDGAWAAQAFHVTREGTFDEGLSTLILTGHPDVDKLADVRHRLLHARSQRFAPYRDDLIVASWNGWLVDSLVQAAEVFGHPESLDLARRIADALWRIHWDGEVLARTSLAGTTGSVGTAEDYGAVALGFARLAGATGDRALLERAAILLDKADAYFGAPDGGWYDAVADDTLYARPRDVADAATPSATSTLVAANRLLGLLADDAARGERAAAGLATARGMLARSPRAAGWLLEQAMIDDEARRGLKSATVVVVSPDGDPMGDLVRASWRMAPAGSAVLVVRPGSDWGDLTRDRDLVDGQATCYICRGTTCFEPVTAVDDLKAPLWRRA